MYLALAVSAAGFPPAIHVLGYSRIVTKEIYCFRLRDYHLLWCSFPRTSTNNIFFDSSRNLHHYLTTPYSAPHLHSELRRAQPSHFRPALTKLFISKERSRVWAFSFSLAATREIIIIFFSSWYWDVSLPRVCFFYLRKRLSRFTW